MQFHLLATNGCHVTSLNQGLSSSEEGTPRKEPENEVGVVSVGIGIDNALTVRNVLCFFAVIFEILINDLLRMTVQKRVSEYSLRVNGNTFFIIANH